MDYTSDEDDFSDSGGRDSKAGLPPGASAQTKAPRYHSNNDISGSNQLTPGAVLQSCNGSDIHTAHGATCKTTSETLMVPPPPPKGGKGSKTKHKFLIVLPGMLSLNSDRKQHDSKKKEDNGNDEDEENSDNDNSDEDEEEKKSDRASMTGDSTAAKSTKSTTTAAAGATLGKLHGLDTDTPTLRIPMPSGGNNGDSAVAELTLVGKKIDSSSKFMMLSCNKKGEVACKVSLFIGIY